MSLLQIKVNGKVRSHQMEVILFIIIIIIIIIITWMLNWEILVSETI